jgi:perosamine synthetase
VLSLLPTELWDYGLGDALRGLASAAGNSKPDPTLSLGELGNAIPVRSARAALVAAIKVLGLPTNARIGVPLYCCPVVFKAIESAGCTPCFIDVEPETYCMSARDLSEKSSQVDAVIPVHMFGNLADMPRLQAAANGKPMIEDCAQSLGSTLDGKAAGSFGTIAAFSFRSGKYLSVGEGGALIANSADLRARLAQAIDAMPTPGRVEELVHVAKTYLRSKLRSKPLYGLVGYHLWSIYNEAVGYSGKSPVVLGKIYRSDLDAAVRRMVLLAGAIERQRANADHYLRALKLPPGMLCHERPGAFYNRYQFPLLFGSSTQRASIADALHRRGIGTAKPYADIPAVAAEHYGYVGGCPASERIAKGVMIVPTYGTLKEHEVQRIAEAINASWADHAD